MERPSFWNVPRDYKKANVWHPTATSPTHTITIKQEPSRPSSGIGNNLQQQVAAHMYQHNEPRWAQQSLNKPSFGWKADHHSSPDHHSGQLYRPHECSGGRVAVIPQLGGCAAVASAEQQERRQFENEKAREIGSVLNQPHRTQPMVTPKPKTRHDYVTGSYLRHWKDPSWQTLPTRSAVQQPEKLRQAVNKLGGHVNPERLVHLQYNSPINMYSQENVASSLMP